MPVEMKIKGLMFDPVSRMPIVILRAKAGDNLLPIFVGYFEANAILQQIDGSVAPRPMTHDLLSNMIDALKGKVERIVITDLRDNTFFATIHIDRDGQKLRIDSRPSDAMALALRVKAPILVEEAVLERSTASGDAGQIDEAERLRRWLENVDPEELGRYEM
ncbi:MAG TPA: bifunctional nuclease family protein [Candidatus Polarisedimenticolaceae bacterium]|nr:bifunctional nuclease family protein [Candidatus Polarisedimenticolaceae bacterium]